MTDLDRKNPEEGHAGPSPLVVLLLVVAAAALRLLFLGREGLWVDEAYTASMARHSFGQIVALLGSDDAPPLFYFLEKIVVALVGPSELGVRTLPLLSGVAACWMAYRLAARFLPRTAGPTLAVFSFSSMAVFYSRQARSYSLLHLLTLVLLYFALDLRRHVSRRGWIGFGLAGLALLYVHNLGALLLLPACLAIAPRVFSDRQARRSGLVFLFFLFAAATPWFLRLLHQLGIHQNYNAWMGTWWKSGRSLLWGPLYSLGVFSNGAAPYLSPPVRLPGFPFSLSALRWIVWAMVAVGLGSAVLRLMPRVRSHEDRCEGRAVLGCYLLFAAFPLIGLAVISAVLSPTYVVGRTDSLALPGFLLLIAAGWTYLPRPRARRWFPVLWMASGVLGLLPLWGDAPGLNKRSDREIAQRLASRMQPGEALVLGPLCRPTMEYYGRQFGFWDRLAWVGSFPSILDANPAGLMPSPLDSAAAYQAQALALRERWEKEGVKQVCFLVVRDPDVRSTSSWPESPAAPAPTDRWIDAGAVGYPQNVLLGTLVGLRDVEVLWRYRQSWVGGDRLALSVPRERWVSVDSLPRLEVRR